VDWNDSTEQAAFREEVQTFLRERLPAFYAQHRQRTLRWVGLENNWAQDWVHGSAEAQQAAREWAAALGERGWVAPHWPKQYGGAGLTAMEQFIFNAELALAGAPMAGTGGLVGPTLMIHGTDEQKQRFLGPTLRGEIMWAQGFSEPGAGSDLASLQCRAVRDGDEYVINGQKLWTSAGHKSNYIFGLFRTDPEAPKHRGISFLLIDQTTPGVSVRPIFSMGWEHATNETFYEDVRVPVANLVGEENRGWYVGMTLLDFERSGIGGAVQMRHQLQQLLGYLRTPEGAAKAAPTLAQARDAVADRFIEAEVLFNLSGRVASMQAQGLVPNYEASMGKIYSSELVQRISRTGMKVFGLYSNLWDMDEPLVPLDARFTQNYCHTVVQSIFGGANEIQRNIIATRGLGLPRG
jgi:alkylation response protein AidB-like acyl-CoA dehydrogenase